MIPNLTSQELPVWQFFTCASTDVHYQLCDLGRVNVKSSLNNKTWPAYMKVQTDGISYAQ